MNNDLISRSVLIQSLRNNVLVDVTPNLEQAIEEQPTAYNVDKVIADLKESAIAHTIVGQQYEADDCIDKAAVERAIGQGINVATEIVKRGFNNRFYLGSMGIRGSNMDKTISKLLQEIAEDICNNYCKHRNTGDEEFLCNVVRDGGKCPLDRLN